MDVPSILQAADVVVMSSHWEGFGLAAVEGMAAQKPVIVSDVRGLREVAQNYGILFPHGDDEALANEIRHLAEDIEYYDQISERCYERARQFDINDMVDAYYQQYISLC